MVFLTIFTGIDSIRPKYRGELSILQFAENYNFYLSLTDNSVTRSEKLKPDGAWYPGQGTCSALTGS